MEDVYTIKVKTKPDTRNLYPSERRYSASTVSGLAWVHIALAGTSFLLACLALVNPNVQEENSLYGNVSETYNSTDISRETHDSSYILVLAPSVLTISALAAGLAAILASVRWYMDRNITWLFVMSVLSTIVSLISFIMIAVWLLSSDDSLKEFKDKILLRDVFIIEHTQVLDRNESHFVIARNATEFKENNPNMFTKRVLSINILIAAFLELLWSILSVKISYKGMRNNYKDGDERRGNCVRVVTTIKGDMKRLPRNGKLVPLKSNLIDHYPSRKIKRIFLAQGDNGFYLKNQNNKAKNTETSSEFYKERMMNFLNRCASLDGVSNPEQTPSIQSEVVLNPIPETGSENVANQSKDNRVTPVSWGDSSDHTVYNQNTLNFEKIFSFRKKEVNATTHAND
ncbi:uncharacterized protein LOC119836497 [Zerene cesonia]|uniref:uncharacterized protein LOC119836497 n=1 Tax=Zerene cesonia TaxID=33412 RepID=UPI0018E5059B|nr:uncharacterized protein LOC119836497 [Zerene cesonia]